MSKEFWTRLKTLDIEGFLATVSDDSFEQELQNAEEEIVNNRKPSIFKDRLLHFRYYAWKKLYAENDDYVVEYNDAFYEWMHYVISPKNNFYFTSAKKMNREDEIKRMITEPDSHIHALNIFSIFFAKPRGQGYLKYLINHWFLPRYDLESVKMIVDALRSYSNEPSSKSGEAAESEPLDSKKKSWPLYWPLLVVVILMTSVFWFNYYPLLYYKLPPFFIDPLHPLNTLMRYEKLGYIKYFTPMLIELGIFILIAYGVCKIKFQHRFYMKLFIPRLISAIAIGYLPLFMGDELWKFAINSNLTNLILIALFSLFITYFYLSTEIRNIVEDKQTARHRTARIFNTALAYSFGVGVIIIDLIGCRFISNIATDDSGVIHLSRIQNDYIFPGIFGIIDPKVLLFFFPLALLIGIFVQIIWEDKPITQPL